MDKWQAKRRIGDVIIFLDWQGEMGGAGWYEGYASVGLDKLRSTEGGTIADLFFNNKKILPNKDWSEKNGVTIFPFFDMYPNVIDSYTNYKSKKEFDSAAKGVMYALRVVADGNTWWLWTTGRNYGQKEAQILVNAAGPMMDDYRVHDNPSKHGLTIHMYYAEGPAYWLLGHLEEFASFERADRQLDEWGHISRGEGVASFAIYIDDELVYDGAYDLAIVPADLKRQVNLFLESLDTQDAVILLGALAEQNPKLEKGYVDPDTGAWRSRRRFETGADVSEMSASIVEDPNTVDDINAALLGGTLGIGSHGLVTVASHERIDTGEGPPEAARTWHHAAERRRQEERRAREAREAQATERTRPTGAEIYRFTPERIAEISAGHGLDLGGYEYENVRDEWARIFADAGIAGVLEIDADTFGGEVMGSSRDFFGINIHSLNSPVVLFKPGANDPDDRWPETLPAERLHQQIRHPDTYVLVNNGVLNEYEHDCICSEEPVDTERENCPRCEGTGYVEHTGGNWALYKWVEGEEIDEDEFTDDERSIALTDIYDGIAKSIMANIWGEYLEGDSSSSMQGINLYHDAPMSPALKDVLEQIAYKFVLKVNELNDVRIETPWLAFATGMDFDPDASRDSAETYGHLLFMEALGRGISWMDESTHEEHGLELPNIECDLQHLESGYFSINCMGIDWPRPGRPEIEFHRAFYSAEIDMENGKLVPAYIDVLDRLYIRCGQNADWVNEAWHVGPSSQPNMNSGDYYILENESEKGVYDLVTLVGQEPNDEIEEIFSGKIDDAIGEAEVVLASAQ